MAKLLEGFDLNKLLVIIFLSIFLIIIGTMIYSAYQKQSISPIQISPILWAVVIFLGVLLAVKIIQGNINWKEGNGVFIIIAFAIVVFLFLYLTNILPEPLRFANTGLKSIVQSVIPIP